MITYEKYLQRSQFKDYADFYANYKITVPESFNFAYDVVDSIASEQPNKLALLWVGENGKEKRFTFADIKRMSDKTANYFRSLGIKKGDKVLVILKRHYQFWFTIIALHKLGAVIIPATNQLKAKDIEYRCNAAHVKMLVVTAEGEVTNNVREIEKNCDKLELKLVVNAKNEIDGFLDFDKGVEAASEVFLRPTGEEANKNNDMMLLYFTSGTTGYPKMVGHDFTYPLGHILTAAYWHRNTTDGLHFTISETGWGKAVWGKLYGQWLSECAIFVYDFDRFHPTDILDKIQQYKITTFCAPPTMYRLLLKEGLNGHDLSSIRHSCTAGEALSPEVSNDWKKLTGMEIFEAFGQTETTACCSTCYPYSKAKLGSMGLPSPGYRVMIADENGNEVGAGVTGEICIKTDAAGGGKPYGLFMGYYENDELTRAAWHDDLFHTGDTAYRDESGYLWYVGRTDDVIKSSGYRIGPFEVESALMEHPAVLECAVTGVPDAVRGKVVKATIVLMQGFEPSEELKKDIQNHVKRVTAPYKYPRIVEFVDALPKTISGKIKRAQIREEDMAKHAAERTILDYDTVALDEANNAVMIIDQTLLPNEITILGLKTADDIWNAIYQLKVRGAPAIGVAAAFGAYIAAKGIKADSSADFCTKFEKVCNYIMSARPTAVNLSWALKKMTDCAEHNVSEHIEDILKALRALAVKLRDDNVAACRAIGENGLKLFKQEMGILTHCNAGKLACVEYGTATAPLYAAQKAGYKLHIFADETRPLLQGARLTAFELQSAGMDVTLICDNMAASLMRRGVINAVIVGADRIAANGDTANKIGTLSAAVCARHFGIPFYVAAPTSTIDINSATGANIVIESRPADEVTEMWYNKHMAPKGVKVLNPAFDVTPSDLISGIITEKGVITGDYVQSIKEICGR